MITKKWREFKKHFKDEDYQECADCVGACIKWTREAKGKNPKTGKTKFHVSIALFSYKVLSEIVPKGKGSSISYLKKYEAGDFQGDVERLFTIVEGIAKKYYVPPDLYIKYFKELEIEPKNLKIADTLKNKEIEQAFKDEFLKYHLKTDQNESFSSFKYISSRGATTENYSDIKTQSHYLKDKVRSRQNGIIQVDKNTLFTVLKKSNSEKRYDFVRRNIYPYLNIADELFADIKPENESLFKIQVQSSDSDSPLLLTDAVKSLWDRDNWHCTLIGDGGMGKTVSLLYLWKQLLLDEDAPFPIFLRLENYNRITKDQQRNFIYDRILDEYNFDTEAKNIKKIFKTPRLLNGKKKPSVILMLDGYNEVTQDKRSLIYCLQDIVQLGYEGVQLIITSRYDISSTFGKHFFETFSLGKLKHQQIKDYIASKKLVLRDDLYRSELLHNPMMLSLYCGTEQELHKNQNGNDCKFIKHPSRKADVFHNFIAALLFRQSRLLFEDRDRFYFEMMVFHLLPKIGFEMEKAGQFECSHKDLKAIIQEALVQYSSTIFLDTHYPKLDLMEDAESIRNGLNSANFDNISKMLKIITQNHAFMRVFEDKKTLVYSFIHQDFRDYFASQFILSRIEEHLTEENKFDFPELQERFLPHHLQIMLGECAGEHHRKPFIKNGEYYHGKKRITVFDRVLDRLRQEFKTIQKRVIETKLRVAESINHRRLQNTSEILKKTRVDLSDTNLSYLDLRNIVLHDARLGWGKINGEYYATNLTGSLLSSQTFFREGHSYPVNKLIAVNKKLSESDERKGNFIFSMSFSEDYYRLWDRNFEWEFTYSWKESINYLSIYSHLLYSGTTGILGDVTVVEKVIILEPDFLDEVKSYMARYTIDREGYTNKYTWEQIHNIISYKAKKYFKSKDEKLIEEMTIVTKPQSHRFVCMLDETLFQKNGDKLSFTSPEKVLLSQKMPHKLVKILKECYNSFFPNNNDIYCSDPNNKIIISIVDNQFFKIWDAKTGSILKTIDTKYSELNATSIAFNHMNNWIFLGQSYGSIQIWDIDKEQFIKKIKLFSCSVNFIAVNKDGKFIVAGSKDSTIIKIWDIDFEKYILLKGHKSSITALTFRDDNNSIISCGVDNIVKIWDITGNCLYSINRNTIGTETYSDVSEDTNTGEIIFSVSPQNKLCVLYNKDSYTKKIRIWDFESQGCIRTIEGHKSALYRATFDKDGKLLASVCIDSIIKIWDVASGECLQVIDSCKSIGSECEILRIVFDLNGTRVASLHKQNTIKIWDVVSGSYLNKLDYPESKFSYVETSIGGKISFKIDEISFKNDNILVALNNNKEFLFWDVASGEYIKSKKSPFSFIDTFAIDNFEDIILATYDRGFGIQFYNLDSEKFLYNNSVVSDNDHSVFAMAYDKNNDLIYTEERGKEIVTSFHVINEKGGSSLSRKPMYIIDLAGFLMQGIDISNLHPDSRISMKEKLILACYGALINTDHLKINDITLKPFYTRHDINGPWDWWKLESIS